MNIDLDQILAAVKPWELTLTIGGRQMAVRRLTNAEFKQLADADKNTPSKNAALLAGLFADQADQHRALSWDVETATTAMGAIVIYYQKVVLGKNLELVAAAIAGHRTTTGSGS